MARMVKNVSPLAVLRYAQGKSGDYMAKVLGVTTVSYYNKEGGRYPFTIEESLKVAKDLKLDVSQYDSIFCGGMLSDWMNDISTNDSMTV